MRKLNPDALEAALSLFIGLLLIMSVSSKGGFVYNLLTDSHNINSVKDCPKGQAFVLVGDKTYCAKPETVITITTK